LATFDKTTNTFSPTNTIGLGQIDQGGSYTAQQQGTSLLLDAGDKRVANLAYSNGFLWGVTEEKPPGSSVPLVHWFKIDVSNPSSPTLVAQGNVSGATLGSNVATFNPSLAIDAAGDVLINFTASGPNLYPQDYYVYQLGSGPVGSFSAPILYQASTGFFNSGSSGVQRWGLYSTTIIDPNNPSSFWISNEYVANGWWQTAVAQVAIPGQPTAPTLTIANSTLNVPAGGSVGVGISVTPANPGDNATVTISGLAAYETITDALDHITFSGNTNTLSAAEVNSGLTLNSTYTGSGQPVNTLTVTAAVTTAAGTANSAAQTITVTDPPVTTIAATPQLELDRSLALLNQFAAAGLQNSGEGVLGLVPSTALPFGSANAETLLSNPHLLSSPHHLV
jgi:hypothetical protein